MKNKIEVNEHFKILGKKVRDKVTGYQGVVVSLCFDLFGCVQVAINPGMTKDEKLGEQFWFDFNRIEILDHNPVMAQPSFVKENVVQHKGANLKPIQRRV